MNQVKMTNSLFFENKIKIENRSKESSQACIFFGRETDLGIRVVLKQYKTKLTGLYREIKIFTEIERLKNGEESKEHSKPNKQYDTGLPHLLCYVMD